MSKVDLQGDVFPELLLDDFENFIVVFAHGKLSKHAPCIWSDSHKVSSKIMGGFFCS